VKNTEGLVLEESKFSISDNWLLLSIPNFLYCTFSFKLVQAAVRFPVPAKTHDEGVHTDVIAEDVVKRQVQGTRYVSFFCVCPISKSQVPYFLGTCEAHHPESGGNNVF
jgi:hypothetical protein